MLHAASLYVGLLFTKWIALDLYTSCELGLILDKYEFFQ
jgi:hypothetical protein